MERVLIYKYENMLRAGKIMQEISAKGAENFRLLAELADILDSGTPGDYEEKKEGEGDAVERKEIQPDKLEK